MTQQYHTEHEHAACATCAICGRSFPHPRPAFSRQVRTCPSCSRPAPVRGGYEPMVQIEAGEHQRLLQLYYAHFEHDVHPSAETAATLRRAMLRCNKFFEGGTSCH